MSKTIKVGGLVTFLGPRASAIFSVLVDRLGERVSKEELLALAWPDRLVHENSIAKAISKLRGAIVGSGLEIAASYGFGYILRETRGVSVAEGPAPATAQAGVVAVATPDSPVARSASPRWGKAAAILAGAIALASGAFVALGQMSSTQTPIREAPPLTNDPRNAIATILWVDDHPSNNVLEVEEFKRRRIAVHLALATDDALKLMAMNSYRLIVSDLGRGEDRLAGLKMIATMRQREMATPVLIYTVRPDRPAGQVAQRKLVAAAGASGLAVTPQEVRSKVLQSLGNPAPAERS